MRGKTARALRRMALEEMMTDNVPKQELVIARVRGHDRVINSPNSIKALTLQLKKAYVASSRKGR